MSKERLMDGYCATQCSKKGECDVITKDAYSRVKWCVDLLKYHSSLERDESKEMVNHPSHYNQYPIETIDMMVSIFGKEYTRMWCVMTAFKYRMRLGHKDGIEQELAKEQWYLNKAKELE